ncbi:MAG: efflux transporter periplasmic adaptor subunit [Gammaproteobacteria bacterium HGW-Gammaproteobacteria-10]|nr:MAG: efflux transporter periplasmic adaptor subunit [Gammaproteobacteria bacterium HGW-Gammaproteobacteria-10]
MSRRLLITGLSMLALGLGAGYWLAGRIENLPIEAHLPEHRLDNKEPEPGQPLFYRHPMNPEITSPVPAKDSMGMDYIPVYADEQTASEPGTVRIDPVTVQNIGVRTARATRTTLSRNVRAVGRVDYDEERIVRLHPKTAGWIEALYVDKTGQWIGKDTDLLSIYSPQLVSAQQEYILALQNQKILSDSPFESIRQGAEDLLASSRKRLQLLDVPAHQLHELTDTKRIFKSLHIHAPTDGIVIQIGAREGQYVTPDTEIFTIANIANVWVYADVYEYELPWIRPGDRAEIRLVGVPGRVFESRVEFIYPYAEKRTRTTRIRLVLDNAEGLLKPDMFADVTIATQRQMETLVVPTEAIIRSGTRNQVFVVREPGKFEPRRVKLGLDSDGQVAIIDGLDEGEEIVVSAQFLIDSESKLREATAKMLGAPTQPQAESIPALHDAEGHKHD